MPKKYFIPLSLLQAKQLLQTEKIGRLTNIINGDAKNNTVNMQLRKPTYFAANALSSS